jgi:flagellar hook protein FlgE
MGITSALNTGLSGLSSSQSQIDVVGNNIANVNTVGFKSSRLDFKTQFLQNFSFGSAPSADLGGTNPIQVGLGTQAGAITRNFGDGSLQVTGVDTNLAIQGDGFFILKDVAGQVYTRDGSFQLNGLNQLVSSTGKLVQGYGVDSNFNVLTGSLGGLTIPINNLTVAQATQNAKLTGQFNAQGTVPTAVSHLTLGTATIPQPLFLTDGAGGVDPTNPPTGTTLLTDLTDSTGAAYFQLGDNLNLTGKIGTANGTSSGSGTVRTIATQTMPITATTTLADLQAFMTGGLGINTTAGINGALTAPGVTIPATGNTVALTLDGNSGAANDLILDANSLTINRAGTTLTPFNFNKTASADGESANTNMVIYDSLGTPVNVSVTAVMTSKSNSGTTWQVFATSPDGTATGANVQTAVGNGTLTFDTAGNLTSTTMPGLTIDRTNTGAQPTLSVTMDFTGTQALSAITTGGSILSETSQDGSKPGTLTGFAIQGDGMIKGSFSNGLSRTLGQIALATFRNNQGLIDKGNNVFTEGPNSGNAVITTPQHLSGGTISSGALELSNVDLSSQFVQLISASTGFSASSRIITTSNQMLQELLSASR